MNSLRHIILIVIGVLVNNSSEAFSRPIAARILVPLRHLTSTKTIINTPEPTLIHIRGGGQPEYVISPSEKTDIASTSESAHNCGIKVSSIVPFQILPISQLLHSFGSLYAKVLQQYPIRTKSVTAGCIFAMSDLLAQSLERKDGSSNTTTQRRIGWSRVVASAAVGFCYFGPAAHYWYEWIFRILPTTSLPSTIQKAILGQMFFGPSFTCIFFAVSLLQTGAFTLPNWFRKIQSDLPAAWLAGAGFWPIVDLISYSFIAPQWIPLFINICSLFWTTYLVLKSYN